MSLFSINRKSEEEEQTKAPTTMRARPAFAVPLSTSKPNVPLKVEDAVPSQERAEVEAEPAVLTTEVPLEQEEVAAEILTEVQAAPAAAAQVVVRHPSTSEAAFLNNTSAHVHHVQKVDDELHVFEAKEPVNKKIEEILMELGVNAAYVRNAVERQKVQNRPLSEVARDTGLVSAEKIAEALSIQTGSPFFRSTYTDKISNVDVESIKKILGEEFKFNGYIPVAFHNGNLIVAISNTSQSSEAKNAFSMYKPRLAIASDKNIQTIYRKYFSNTDKSFDLTLKAALASIDDVQSSDTESVQNVIGDLLRHACFVGASDIYLFSDSNEGTVKLKIGGRGKIFRFIRKDMFLRVTQLIVTMTGKSEGLTQGPVDAKLELKEGLGVRYKDVASRYVFRLSLVKERSTGDTTIVIRVNDSQSNEAEFDQLGFDVATTLSIKKHISNPHGLALISGPTGSGKTTSLYAILREINSLERTVLTMEKPIEYRNGSWIQYELRGDEEEGDEAREMLNAMLRQSPDVIFMGELRDNYDLAKVCVTAANTGHLVFSTIHTNDSPSTLTRLLNLKVPAIDIANVLRFVLSMRLIPLLCKHCKVPDERIETSSQITADFLKHHKKTPYHASPGGCEHCDYTGVRGRKSVYEFMDGAKAGEYLVAGKSINEIRHAVFTPGDTMWGRGLVYVADGLVSIDDLINKVGKQ